MPEHHPNEDEDGEALTAEFLAQLTRVGVDMRAASPRMHETVLPQETENEDGTIDVVFTIDVSGIVETLRRLPDDVGTDAFVRAYNAQFPDLDSPASKRKKETD
jgi:hypothetical protein